MNALGNIAKKYGPVEVFYSADNDPYRWCISLVATHDGTATWNHVHGERLEESVEALWEQLENFGVMTMEEAMRLGTPTP